MSSYPSIDRLAGEPHALAEVRNERGAPRLFVNGEEKFPLLAWSWLLEPSIYYFKRSGINLIHPILGLNEAWKSPERFDWSLFERHFDALLEIHPEAFFLPRVHLDVPDWWKDKYPGELVETAIPAVPKNPRQYREVRINPEGGMAWGIPLTEVSLASEVWKADMDGLLGAFLEFMEASPLSSRIIGYQLGAGIYGEWHYPAAEFMPDCSSPVVNKIGRAPTAKERLHTGHGLLRDPVAEDVTIKYYERLHRDVTADALLHFASLTKEATSRKVLVGSFQTYLLENVWVQEGGHLAPRSILESPDIDFIASPYSYQTTNQEDQPWYEHDVFDDGGNYLGRSRGVGGDGGYRVLLESIRRAGKLFFAEIDPSTYLEPHPEIAPDDEVVRELPLMGGVGSTTPEGTRDILRRDVGRLLVSGSGGWLFDFGPTMATRRSWYADEPIIQTIRELVAVGEGGRGSDVSPVAEIAAIYDYRSFFYTRHWLAEAPFQKGSVNLDFFSKWFLTSQSRVLHRVGAPVDFLFHFDLTREDLERYRLILVPNLFYLPDDELVSLRNKIEGTGTTLVWFYGPGIVSDSGLDARRVSDLMGMEVKLDSNPGSMMIASTVVADEPIFGADSTQSPRLIVTDDSAEILGRWTDTRETAFARKSAGGVTSVFVGSAPLPVGTLRQLCIDAGARLWSTENDIVVASRDWTMIVATTDGDRSVKLHRPLRSLDDGSVEHEFIMRAHQGQVSLFGPT
jgi:hypothetical protein